MVERAGAQKCFMSRWTSSETPMSVVLGYHVEADEKEAASALTRSTPARLPGGPRSRGIQSRPLMVAAFEWCDYADFPLLLYFCNFKKS